MVTNQKVTGTASSMPGGLAVGAGISLLITFVGSWLSAYLISTEKLPQSAIGYCAMGILLLSALLGALVAVHRIKRRRLYACILSGLIYYIILLSMTALFFGGQYQGMGVTALLVVGGTGTAALLSTKGEGSYRHRKKRKFPC